MRNCSFILLLFYASQAGAQWVSTNGLPGGAYSLSIVCSDSVFYLGTREGVYRSTDYGKKWNQVSFLVGHPEGQAILTRDSIVLVGYGGGIFRSSDRGGSWTRIHTYNIMAFCFHNNMIFAATSDRGVARSTDDGVTWDYVSSGLPALGSPPPLIWTNALLSVGDQLFVGTTKGVYVTTDNGTTWSLSSSGLVGDNAMRFAQVGSTLLVSTPSGIFRSTNGGSIWSRVHTSTSYFSMAVTDSTIFAIGSRLFCSTDGGENWVQIDTAFILRGSAIMTSRQGIFAGTEAGVYYSSDLGISWSARNEGIVRTRVTALWDIHNELLAGTYKNFLFRSTDSTLSWTAPLSGQFDAAIHAFAIKGNYMFAVGSAGVHRSADSGRTWTQQNLGIWQPYSHTIAIHDSLIFVGSRGGVLASSDNGDTWVTRNNGLLRYNEWAYAISSIDGILLLATDGGTYRSTDSGHSWVVLDPNVRGAWAFLKSGSWLFAAGGGTLYRSTDNGSSWMSATTGIWSPVTSITAYKSILFAGTEDGVFQSFDDATTWSHLNTGLVDKRILSLHVKDGYLYCGTAGAGVWRRPVSEVVSVGQISAAAIPKEYALYQNFPNPFNAETRISFVIPSRDFATLKIFNSLGAECAVLFSGELEGGSHTYRWMAGSMPSGVYFYRLTSGTRSQTMKLVLLR